LDHAVYAVAVASGRATIENAFFPFSGTPERFESNLKGRCKDVPQEIYPLFRSYEPYKGGSALLWALNEVCVGDKHKIIVPAINAIGGAGVNVRGTGFMKMPDPPTWDRTKNEMELFTLGPGAELHGDFTFAFYIAFTDVESLNGKPVIPILDQFVSMVKIIINEIERETARLFPESRRKV
jgi:hypothetical protein